jgi:hypothetical protein
MGVPMGVPMATTDHSRTGPRRKIHYEVNPPPYMSLLVSDPNSCIDRCHGAGLECVLIIVNLRRIACWDSILLQFLCILAPEAMPCPRKLVQSMESASGEPHSSTAALVAD